MVVSTPQNMWIRHPNSCVTGSYSVFGKTTQQTGQNFGHTHFRPISIQDLESTPNYTTNQYTSKTEDCWEILAVTKCPNLTTVMPVHVKFPSCFQFSLVNVQSSLNVLPYAIRTIPHLAHLLITSTDLLCLLLCSWFCEATHRQLQGNNEVGLAHQVNFTTTAATLAVLHGQNRGVTC